MTYDPYTPRSPRMTPEQIKAAKACLYAREEKAYTLWRRAFLRDADGARLDRLETYQTRIRRQLMKLWTEERRDDQRG